MSTKKEIRKKLFQLKEGLGYNRPEAYASLYRATKGEKGFTEKFNDVAPDVYKIRKQGKHKWHPLHGKG